MLNIIYFASMGLFVLVCVCLIGLVLLQRGRGGGVAGMFSGGSNSAFGVKTPTVITGVTVAMFSLFLVLAIALNLLAERHQHNGPLSISLPTNSPIAPR